MSKQEISERPSRIEEGIKSDYELYKTLEYQCLNNNGNWGFNFNSFFRFKGLSHESLKLKIESEPPISIFGELGKYSTRRNKATFEGTQIGKRRISKSSQSTPAEKENRNNLRP